MASQAELMAEAYKRGLLPPDKRALYEEAQRRGLVGEARAPKRTLDQNVRGAMANLNRGLAVGDELAAAGNVLGGLVTGRHRFGADRPGNVIANNLNMLGDAYRTEMAAQRQSEDSFTRERPKTAALMRGTGNALTVAAPVGPSANMLAATSRLGGAAKGALAAATMGAGYAAADRGSVLDRAKAATSAATDPLTLAMGAAGGALAVRKPKRVPEKVSRPVDPDVELLAREGVQMTPGQMRGRIAKSAEDAATSTPVLGDAIAERRVEGVQTFNRAVINRALKQVGEELPADLTHGTDAVRFAGDRLSRGYEEAIPNRVVRADPGFADDVRKAFANTETLTPDSRARLADILDQRLTSRLPANGAMDGRMYKTIQSELDFEVSRFSKATDPDQRAMGDAIEGVQQALENAARRQDPQFAARIDALDRGWAELGRIESAAAKSADLSGVFTPAQYAQSVRAADGRVRRRGVARGEALSQDLAGAAVRVLPSKMPDSGTAGRAAWGMVTAAPGAVIGAMTGGGPGAVAGIAGTAATLGAASRAYSPQAVQAANIALSERINPAERQKALRALAEIAATDPNAVQLYREVAAKLSRVAGATGAAAQQ